MEQGWIPTWVETLKTQAIMSDWTLSTKDTPSGICVYMFTFTKNGKQFQLAAMDYGKEKEINVGFLREKTFKFEYPGRYFVFVSQGPIGSSKEPISEEDFLKGIQIYIERINI